MSEILVPTLVTREQMLAGSPDLRDDLLIWSFLAGLGNEGTRRAYSYAIQDFRRWLLEHGADSILDADRTRCNLYVRHLQNGGGSEYGQLKNSSILRRIAALSSFASWCEDEEYAPKNPWRRVTKPADDSVHTVPITLRELAAVLAFAQNESADAGLACLLAGLSGYRASEVCAFHVDKLVTVGDVTLLQVIAKGSKQTRQPLPAPTLAAIDRLQHETGRGWIADTEGNPLSRSSFGRMVARAGRGALGRHLHPHQLRTSVVTICLGADVPITRVSAAVNHSDISTTSSIYDANRYELDVAGHPATILSAMVASVAPSPPSAPVETARDGSGGASGEL
jgi:site-specific recombinase XerD